MEVRLQKLIRAVVVASHVLSMHALIDNTAAVFLLQLLEECRDWMEVHQPWPLQ